MKRKTKQDLLKHYSDKPAQRLLQIDSFTNGHPADAVMPGDDDGDQLMYTITDELMSTPGKTLPLRILIHEDADPRDVRRLLEKSLRSLDSALDFLREEAEAEVLARAGIRRRFLLGPECGGGLDEG